MDCNRQWVLLTTMRQKALFREMTRVMHTRGWLHPIGTIDTVRASQPEFEPLFAETMDSATKERGESELK